MPEYAAEYQEVVTTVQLHDGSYHRKQQPQPQQRAEIMEKRSGHEGFTFLYHTSVSLKLLQNYEIIGN